MDSFLFHDHHDVRDALGVPYLAHYLLLLAQ
jgi:hypothetical protein